MEKFNFEIISETEKAVFAKVPYWEPTSQYKKKHTQKFYECWIPKSVLAKDASYIQSFVLGARNDKRLKNAYQKLSNMPSSWRTMGEYAPEKIKEVVVEVDGEKLMKLRAELMAKHNVKDYDQGFFINPGDDITIEIEALANAYRGSGKIEHPMVPKRNVTYYK